MGATTLLNKHGDWTITWARENDEKAEQMIRALLDKGVVFWIVHPRGARSQVMTVDDEVMKRRHIAIDDEHILAFVTGGGGELVKSSDKPVKTLRRPKGETKEEQAKDIAAHETVGIQQRRGG